MKFSCVNYGGKNISLKKISFFAIVLIFIFSSLSTISATDLNESVDITETENDIHLDKNNNTFVGSNLADESLNNNILNSESDKNTSIKSSDIELYYKNGTRFAVVLIDENGVGISNQILLFNINGNEYEKVTEEAGNSSIAINLIPGKYTINVSFKGTDSYNSISVSNEINIKETIFGEDIVKYYQNGTQYYATFLDNQGKALTNTNVTFNINGVFYTRTTNENGTARLNINLNPDEYTLTAIHPITELYYSNKITVLPTIQSTNLTKIHLDENHFYATFLNNDGNTLINTNVTFNINGVFYTRTTNENGTARLNINLNPDEYTLTAIHPKDSLMRSFIINVLINENKIDENINPTLNTGTNSTSTIPSSDNSNAYWVFGRDMYDVNLAELSSNGIGNIFLNFFAISLHGQSNVESWISTALSYNINVHIWMQAFYDDDGWNSPVKDDGTYNYELFNNKIDEAIYYSDIKGVAGIHLDYLRYPGNAYEYSGGTQAINEFVRLFSQELKKINSNLILSAAVMPETTSNSYYYGQDVSVLGNYLDVIIPMIYKGNYKAGTSWITTITNWYVLNSAGAEIWSGLQGYNSDDDVTQLSITELSNDAQAALDGGASGSVIFRFGVSNIINFNDLNKISTDDNENLGDLVSLSDIISAATNLKSFIENTGALPQAISINNKDISVSQFLYLMAQGISNFNTNDNFYIVASSFDGSNGDVINGLIYSNEYLLIASEVVNYIDVNGKSPVFISTSLGNVQYNTLVYIFSKILNFVGNNNKLPQFAYTSNLIDNYALTVSMLPSASGLNGQYQYITYTSTWLNYCPACDYYGTLLINPKNTHEGELTCSYCDADYCGVSGYEKISSSSRTLTRISFEGSDESGASGELLNFDDIVIAANSLKNFIVANDDLPESVTISDKLYSISQILYLMSVATLNINNNDFSQIEVIDANNAANPQGDIINSYLNLEEYIDLASRVANFIINNGQVPNYASSNIGKIISSELIDAFSRILAYYEENGILPSQVSIIHSGGSSKTISELAISLTSNLDNDWDKATALFNYVRDNIAYSFYYDTVKGAEGALSSGSANCCDKSQLLVALSRTVDLTIRFVHGTCTFSSGTYGHVWCEILIDGTWYLADTTSSRNSLGTINNWNTNTATIKNRYTVLPF